jgi:glycosyltransferase involved in cell wall biosynthesis
MSSPSVSVIVPTHQRRPLVRRAVESVLAQTHEDLELVVIDDGSTDGTGEELAELDDGRLRYVWQENAGVAAARNRAQGMARGEIVAFLDSDNYWLPDHLEVLVEVLERQPEALFATTCESFEIEGDSGPESAGLVDLWPRVFNYGRRAGFVSGVAIRREPLEEVGGFDERFRAGEDTDLFVRLGVLGPMASVGRRTHLRGHTTT